MNFEEYVEAAMSFTPEYAGTEKEKLVAQICHSVLGYIGERNEYIEEMNANDKIEELGDCWWYLAIGFGALTDLTDFDLVFDKNSWQHCCINIEYAANEVEKGHFQSRDFDIKGVQSALCNEAYNIAPRDYAFGLLDDELKLSCYSLSEVWDQNIQKLEERHGGD